VGLLDLLRARGKYIAFCEGDDYWTDPYKLQKQVNFLEANPEYVLCFHNANIVYENKKKKPKLFNKLKKNTYNIIDIIKKPWFIPTASIVLRKRFLDIPEWFKYVYNGDFALQLILARKGNFYFIDEVMSVYRKHDLSIAKQMSYKPNDVLNSIMEVLLYFNYYSSFEYNDQIKDRLKELDKKKYRTLLYSRPLLNRMLNIDFYFYKIISKLNHYK